MKNKKVVWVTGEFDPGEETSGLFDGVEFVTPETVSEAKEVIESSTASESGSKIDCVVSEYELEDGTAFDVFEDVRERIPDTPCILFTDRDIEEIRSEYRPVIVDYLRREGDEDDYSKLLSLISEAT
ncbi:MAG: hypothetical protein SV760_08130, partial [Halobacteria archaeon]|nr:hypothetical protein [Halobacteria archaeon]